MKISPKQITTLKTAIEAALSDFIDQGTNLDSGAVFLFQFCDVAEVAIIHKRI